MNTSGSDKLPALSDINIRNTLMPGDIGSIIAMHGALYGREYQYGISFETYVAKGLLEFYENYNPQNERVWICEHNNTFAGSLLLASRGDAAQLRYFILAPPYRGIGLGKKLMTLYMAFLKQCHYTSSFLWTTHELSAAAALYKKHGFILTEEVESDAFGKPLREQKYILPNIPR
jgi:peptidyl-dipeptidase Dcp